MEIILNFFSKLFYLIKEEIFFIKFLILNIKDIFHKVINTFKKKNIFGIITYTILVLIIFSSIEKNIINIFVAYLIFKLLIYIITEDYKSIKDYFIGIKNYILNEIWNSITLFLYLILIIILLGLILNFDSILSSINPGIILIGIIILLIVVNLGDKGEQNQTKTKSIEIKKSKEEIKKEKYFKNLLSTRKSIFRNAKFTKAFYIRKGMLFCICGNTGYLYCKECGKPNKKLKRAGKCSYCKTYISNYTCNKCDRVHYLK